MQILYGTKDYAIDVTSICYENLVNNNIITIPKGDGARANLFTDPIGGVLKKILLKYDNNVIKEFEENIIININTITNEIITIPCTNIDDNIVLKELESIHNKLKLKYGSFRDEFPEQKMACKYIKGHEKVLEIGGNIGRNTLIIAHLLSQSDENKDKQMPFVSLECDYNISRQLIENRDINNFNFYVENSALSKRKLIQRGWDTIESDIILEGYQEVNIISYDKLKKKYNIEFDTLVLDCEGAFYYILMDMPEILDNIQTIIMENDYWDINKKIFIDEYLKNNKDNKFYLEYFEKGGWGPCQNNFYEVWKRKVNK